MAMSSQRVRPRFMVRKLDGDITRIAKVWDVDQRRFVDKEVTEPGGYMVSFPNNHSVRMSESELKHHGFDRDPTLVDMNTGVDVEMPEEVDFEAAAKAGARRSGRSAAA